MEAEDVKDISQSQEEVATTETVEEVQAGSKTPPNLLLESLQEEREKRRKAEQALIDYQNTQGSDDVFSDEGKALQQKIDSLNEKLELKEIREQFPVLKDKSSEFSEFRKDYPGIGLEKVAKLFISENNLVEAPATRKGLERSSGGGRIPVDTGQSEEDVAKIRTENPRKYREMLKEGKIRIGRS